ncbi:hypothetical protein ACH5RR_001433 [Cinchona calisaya]|uniref:Uncharacterized protein n=1 Tax=Cinchona calisaya TaxID=153742 RepID=A0ABD3B3D4_9GENT
MSRHEGQLYPKIMAILEKSKTQQNDCIPIYSGNQRSRERPESYVDDFYSKETCMRSYEPSLHPVNGPGLSDKTNMRDIMPPNYGRDPGRPKKARRRQLDEENNKNNSVKNMLSKKRGKVKCSSCHQFDGHNRLRCPTKAREIELEVAENQVQDGVEVPPSTSDVEATTDAVEVPPTAEVEEATTAVVEVPVGGVVMRSSTTIVEVETAGRAVNVKEVKGERATKKRKYGIYRKYVGHTKANYPHADPYRGELCFKYKVPPPKKAKVQSSTTTTSQNYDLTPTPHFPSLPESTKMVNLGTSQLASAAYMWKRQRCVNLSSLLAVVGHSSQSGVETVRLLDNSTKL